MKKIMTLAVLVLTALLLSSCGDDYAVDIYGSLSGQVTDYSSGDPLVNVQVTLLPGARTTQTGTDGSFFFDGLDAGQYVVSVQKTGYSSNRKNVTVISNETVSIVIPLTSISGN